MTKTITPAMRDHLDGTRTTLATCWRITRQDGVEFFFTAHDRDVPYDGNTYVAALGFRRSAIENTADMAPDNLEVGGILDDDGISEEEMRAGLFDYAEIRVFDVNWADTSPTMGDIKHRRGRLGQVSPNSAGWFRAELRGMAQQLSQTIIDIYQPDCRTDVGSETCMVPIDPPLRGNSQEYSAGDDQQVPSFVKVAVSGSPGQQAYGNVIFECTTAGTSAASPPTFDTTPGNTTVDGGVTWTCRTAWTRHGAVASVTSNRVFSATLTEPRAVDGWFADGVLTWESGDNEGRSVEVKNWDQSSALLELFRAMAFPVQIGDLFRVYPGCDNRIETCMAKWVIAGSVFFDDGNALNYQGNPDIPGPDALTNYPDARG